MFFQLFNWILGAIGSLFTFVLFTDLGGIQLAYVFGGILIATVAFKTLLILIGLPLFSGASDQVSKTTQHYGRLKETRTRQVEHNAKNIERALNKARR